MNADAWGAVVVVALYLGVGIALLVNPSLRGAVKALPSFITDSIQEWAYQTQLDQQHRAFLKSYVKAETEAERKRLVIAELRVHLMAMGLDVSEFSDEEIEAGTVRFGKLIAEFGITAEEAGRNISAALCRGDLA